MSYSHTNTPTGCILFILSPDKRRRRSQLVPARVKHTIMSVYFIIFSALCTTGRYDMHEFLIFRTCLYVAFYEIICM